MLSMTRNYTILHFGFILGTYLDCINALRRLSHTLNHVDSQILFHKAGQETLFWKDAGKCATISRFALAYENSNQAISETGQQCFKQGSHYNRIAPTPILVAAGFTT